MGIVYLETYGCAANQSDSEIMAGLLSRSGFCVLASEALANRADAIIINTCTVKAPTEQRALFRIAELQKLGKPLVVAGCLAQSSPEKVREIAPSASIVGTRAISEIARIVMRALAGERVEELGEGKPKVCLPRRPKNPVIGIVQISEGCTSSCAFCATKKARGNLKSYSIDDIVSDIASLRSSGVKEFWLTSQDCGAYGLDIGSNLAQLLNAIANKVTGKYFIRVGMANPTYVKAQLAELIEAFKHQNVFKFLHIPMQSGSDRVLKEMKRGHTSADVADIVEEFRKAMPGIQIWTDMIVGYPAETEEDFQRSLEAISSMKPDYVNVSRFGARPGTEAAKLKPLPTEVLKERSRKMSALCRSIALEQNKKWLGWSGSVLIDEYNAEKKTVIGRNFAYKPIVIGRCAKIGQVVDVKVVKADRVLFGALENGAKTDA